MGKVLDLTARLNEKSHLKNLTSAVQLNFKNMAQVVDMTAAREEIISEERREVKRTILTEFVGAFIVVPNHGLVRVSLYDISLKGLSFDMDSQFGRLTIGEDVAMRIYLNHTTYFPFTTKVTNVRYLDEEGVVRHGVGYLDDSVNSIALQHFVQFIENVSMSLKRDDGDIIVSHIS